MRRVARPLHEKPPLDEHGGLGEGFSHGWESLPHMEDIVNLHVGEMEIYITCGGGGSLHYPERDDVPSLELGGWVVGLEFVVVSREAKFVTN